MSGVYIHIPFCHSKCAYCDFFSRPGVGRAGEVCHAIAEEFKRRVHELKADHEIRTLYVGGGTPSILDVNDLATAIAPIPLGNVEEFTIEVNPEDVSLEKAQAWRRLGVNRVSMGVQSFYDEELRAVGRRHTAEQAKEAFCTLRRAGFDNISLDLIYGLPLQTEETWLGSLNALLDLRPEHFSAYALTYEHGTRLSAWVAAGKLTPTDDDTVANMYEMLTMVAKAIGYEHYEISNFALPVYRSRHNSSYWNSTPYLGLGPAAHSFDGKTRCYNPSEINAYLASLTDKDDKKIPAIVDEETERDSLADLIFTRLRTSEGLSLDILPPDARESLLAAAHTLPSNNIEITRTHLRIPEKHWLISNSIIMPLLPD